MSLSEELIALATAPASLETLDLIFKLDDDIVTEVMFACKEEQLVCTDWYPFVIDLCETDPVDEFDCEIAALIFAPELLDENTFEYIGQG